MKIFNRGNDSKGTAAATTAMATAPAPAGPAAAAAAPAPAAPAPAAAPAVAPVIAAAPDLSVILDANVKEMSEKIARLASSLDSAQQDRSGFEAKIEQMEDRMRKLSSLTEMISAQYNPFVGDAPSERGEIPRPEVGLAPPPESQPLPVPVAMAPFEAMPAPPQIEAALPIPSQLTASLQPPPAALDLSALPTLAEPALPMLAPDPFAQPAPAPAFAAPAPGPSFAGEPGVYLWSSPPGFESSMVLLNWADLLLKTAGTRQSLLELVNYYHNIGWIGDPARDQLLAYADGLATPASGAEKDWRADVEVHARSLLFVEKLRAASMRRTG